MAPFEPSTWAEVSEAIANPKTAPTEPLFVLQVRSFTQSPHHYLAHPPPSEHNNNNKTLDNANAPTHFNHFPSSDKLYAPHVQKSHRSDGLFDDLLGLGRVDLASGVMARRHSIAKPNFPNCSTQSPINPSCHQFQPSEYLARVHADTPLHHLRQASHNLHQLSRTLDSRKERYRQQKFLFAAYIKAQFERAKHSIQHLSPCPDEFSAIHTQRQFLRAENSLRGRYEQLLQRETQLERLQGALTVYKRYAWLFSLGNTLRSAANGNVSTVESTFREYMRAQTWLSAQPPDSLQVLRRDMQQGFDHLVNETVERLSNVHTSAADTSSLVSSLFLVNKEEHLSYILSKRMATAEKALDSAIAAAELPTLLSDDMHTDTELADLVTRASDGLYVALGQVWRLGHLLMQHDQWLRIVDSHIIRLCNSYVKVVREDVMQDVSLITRQIVKEITSTRLNALNELRISETCLAPLQQVSTQVTDAFLISLARAVRRGAEKWALSEVERNSVGASSAKFLRAVVVEALVQIESSWVRGKELDEGPVTITDQISDSDDDHESPTKGPSVDCLSRTCAEAPLVFVKTVENMMSDYKENESAALQVAVCCTEMVANVLSAIEEKTGLSSPYDSRATQRQLQQVSRQIAEIKDRALKAYVVLVFEPFQRMAGALVKFPKNKLDDSVSRTVPIKIVGVSKAARELVLRLALVMITTVKRTSHPELLSGIMMKLISGIGQTLIGTLGTDKLAYNRAAQLWVDVMYMQAMVTKGANADTSGLQASLDGFSKVKERAVQAVLADGFSFSLADMKTLREQVVESELQQAPMICECFMETWSLVVSRGEDD
ncbi:hypothetical protein BWQ96_06627 [Gracilariopsis chorda]|uniref:Exocyst complex component EXOC2/Sec5 N-terminal domain-containing protein n=1 Tax=Gracilariopsis chorda TaxID=448386 RepID=A0A2V3INF6_9FLOR|nr:hypothetical protein BWQ96_06627 [Gracilariopsis chorda]|eukprot:PXF43618.1 hypothetical protein BWQ96_06627 [Gracilariopsis chorda]